MIDIKINNEKNEYNTNSLVNLLLFIKIIKECAYCNSEYNYNVNNTIYGDGYQKENIIYKYGYKGGDILSWQPRVFTENLK